MSKILVLSEIQNQGPKPVTLEILGKLNGHQAEVVFVGGTLSDDGKKLCGTYGAKSVHHLKGASFDSYSPEGYAKVLHDFIKEQNYDYVFSGATAIGKDLLPRLATCFNAGCASDVTQFLFEGDQFFGTRPFFAGKCLAKVEITGPKPHFISIRPNALGLTDKHENVTPSFNEKSPSAINDLKAVIKEVVKAASTKVDLTEANIIVSGGRAMKNSDNFKILNELADVIGATVGASRAAVDSGFAPHAMQVGQTGKTVSPTLYIACGISGAIQHLAGMRTSKFIVAINTDPEAPIFTKADYGIVGDLFTIVPMLTAEFKKLLGK